MVKRADTVQKYNECVKYLESHKVTFLVGTELYYIEDEEIKGVAGWNIETGNLIEPFKTDNKFISIRLWDFMTGLIAGKGFKTVSVITNDEKMKGYLKENGFLKFNEQVTHFIKLSN